MKATRIILLVICGLIIVWLLLPILLPLNTPDVASAVKHQPFLQPSQWDTNSLNPAQTNFSSVILSGHYEMIANGARSSSGNFEIVMSGYDLYFKRRWEIYKHSWYWNIEMAVTNFTGFFQMHPKASSPNGAGGGGSNMGGKSAFLPARRLWNGNNFIGASDKTLLTTNAGVFSKESEEFSNLQQLGPYLIPKTITFVDFENYRWIYYIEKIQFRDEPDADWFVKICDKWFWSSHELEKDFLSEQSGSKTNN